MKMQSSEKQLQLVITAAMRGGPSLAGQTIFVGGSYVWPP